MLTDKQKAFVDEYLIDLNATRAYKSVYKSCKKDESARANGSKLLTNANVIAYLEVRQADLQKRTEITQDMIVNELAKIGFADVADFVKVDKIGNDISVKVVATDDIPIEKRAAIAGIKQGINGIEIKLNDKVKALELLGRHLGMFNDKLELKGGVGVTIIDDIGDADG